MKNRLFWGALFCMSVVYPTFGQKIKHTLDIPMRFQWDNDGGFCGETSIQMIGLYYGNYISQHVVRKMAGGEVLLGENESKALNALHLEHKNWDNAQTPANMQYKPFLVWVKQQLHKNYPVIFTVFTQEGDNDEYDHIVCAVGFSGNNPTEFDAKDKLVYNSGYDEKLLTRTFESLPDTRKMSGNGQKYAYCIPQNTNYGTVVFGNKDPKKETFPVQLSIDMEDEPNVSLKEKAEELTGTIKIKSLTAGQAYVLLRYDDPKKVPLEKFSPKNASSTIYFTATGSTHSFTDTFMSDASIFYRCVKSTTKK